MTRLARWLCTILLLLASGCAALGVSPADTFNKKLAAAYSTHAAVTESALVLYKADKLSKLDAGKIAEQTSIALSALDAAAVLSKTDITTAESRLVATIAILTALQAHLQEKGK